MTVQGESTSLRNRGVFFCFLLALNTLAEGIAKFVARNAAQSSLSGSAWPTPLNNPLNGNIHKTPRMM